MVSLALSAAMLAYANQPFVDTISIIGKNNRLLFAFFSLSTSIAIIGNVYITTHHTTTLTHHKLQKVHKLVAQSLCIICVLALLSLTFIDGQDPQVYDPKRLIHISSSMIFGISDFFLTLYLLITHYIKHKNYGYSLAYLASIVASCTFFLVRTLQLGWFAALTQVILVQVSIFTLLCTHTIQPKLNQSLTPNQNPTPIPQSHSSPPNQELECIQQ